MDGEMGWRDEVMNRQGEFMYCMLERTRLKKMGWGDRVDK